MDDIVDPNATISSSKKIAARRQIDAAIEHFFAGDAECAVTLALAAEGQMPEASAFSLFNRLKDDRPDELTGKTWIGIINELRDWLKHRSGQDEREISQFEVAVALARALTCYWDRYAEETNQMVRFLEWYKAAYPKGGPE